LVCSLKKRLIMFIIHPLYLDFFSVLDDWNALSPEDKINKYYSGYFNKEKTFFQYLFFEYMNFTADSFHDRIIMIKPEDYSNLISVCKINSPERIIKETISLCQKYFYPENDIEIYLIIGFFSPDGLNTKIKGKKNRVIVIGLERYQDMSMLEIVLAHEYGHLLLKPKTNMNIWEKIHREGIAFLFSSLVLTNRPLHKILFIDRNSLYEVQSKIAELKVLLVKKEISLNDLFRMTWKQFPDRAGNPLSYLYARDLYQANGFDYILAIKDIRKSVINWCMDKKNSSDNCLF